MFTSATLKLTAWYLVNLVVICLIFSFIIFELSTSEISNRLERLQIRVEGSSETITLPGPVTLNEVRMNQTKEARASIFVGLVYMNIAVITLGGFGSYMLARRTLKPIEEAHEAQSRFTSDASHELRTPLAVMKSEIQVALRGDNMNLEEYKELLKSNLEEVDKLTELSHSLLQLSRLEHEDIQRTDKIDVSETLKHAAKRSGLATKRLRFDASSKGTYIDGNQSMISDLFTILFDNAYKYSPPHTTVTVTLTTNGRTCKVSIENEGEGIEKDDIPHVFDRFYRASKSRSSSETKGYGLGLSLAQKITAIHEGSISVSSKLGVSTIFSVQLPQVRKNR